MKSTIDPHAMTRARTIVGGVTLVALVFFGEMVGTFGNSVGQTVENGVHEITNGFIVALTAALSVIKKKL
jgi:hypothetical protein